MKNYLCHFLISTHTPVKGVTWGWILKWIDFQKFQLTRPWRAWLNEHSSITKMHYFNSHAREGRDQSMIGLLGLEHLFQLTRPWRAWLKNIGIRYGNQWISTHTPVKGVTQEDLMDVFPELFQLTRPWRAWPLFVLIFNTCSPISTHTPVKGVTKSASNSSE